MATNGDLTNRLLAGITVVAFFSTLACMMIGRPTASAQPPVRPRAPFTQEPKGPAAAAKPRAIKGQVRLDSIDRAFKGATLTVSLYRTVGPDQDIAAERVAELKIFNVYNAVPRSQTYVPFTFGDFVPRSQVRYTLQCYLDMNANDVRDAGDYWNERRVDVLTPDDPEVVRIEDFAAIGEAR